MMASTHKAAKQRGAAPKISKKAKVLLEIFDICQKRRDYVFDNDLVKEAAEKHGFGNPFDVTKIDNKEILPDKIKKQDFCVIHRGDGVHEFVQPVNDFFHNFEPIKSATIEWPYRKSALNEIDESESNILSVGFNQRIIHDFLYEDIVASPKMYGAKRTKLTQKYKAGRKTITLNKCQMEIDLTTEHQGVVTIFEGKNKFPDSFAIYQLFHPILYFHKLREEKKIEIEKINCCYLLRDKKPTGSIIRLYLYSFKNPNDITSIILEKSAQYRLIKR